MYIGSGRRAASRLFKLKTLKTQPQPPKDTAWTLKIKRAVFYSRVSGSVGAHLVNVNIRNTRVIFPSDHVTFPNYIIYKYRYDGKKLHDLFS